MRKVICNLSHGSISVSSAAGYELSRAVTLTANALATVNMFCDVTELKHRMK